MDVAVIGATGAVGREMTRILEERCVAGSTGSCRSRARGARAVTCRSAARRTRCHELWVGALEGVDGRVRLRRARRRRRRSCPTWWPPTAPPASTTRERVQDGRRRAPRDPGGEPRGARGLAGVRGASSPCRTARRITAMLALGPLHRAAGMTSLVMSSYQAVSGAGSRRGHAKLTEQVEKLSGGIESLAPPGPRGARRRPRSSRRRSPSTWSPKFGEFGEDGYTVEETKLMAEPRKILDAPDLHVGTATEHPLVPVVSGHAVSLVARFARPIDPGRGARTPRRRTRRPPHGRPGERRLPHAAGGSGRRRCPGRRGRRFPTVPTSWRCSGAPTTCE